MAGPESRAGLPQMARPEGVGGNVVARAEGVGGNRAEGVGGNRTEGVGGNRTEGVGGNRTAEVKPPLGRIPAGARLVSPRGVGGN
jgi:hypothetical protein